MIENECSLDMHPVARVPLKHGCAFAFLRLGGEIQATRSQAVSHFVILAKSRDLSGEALSEDGSGARAGIQ